MLTKNPRYSLLAPQVRGLILGIENTFNPASARLPRIFGARKRLLNYLIYLINLLQNNISANFSKFRLQNLKSSSAYNRQRARKEKFIFLFERVNRLYGYITYKHRRFLNFLLTKFEKIISKVGAIHELPLQFLQKVL
ncbi:hypothetical protein COT96_01120 [Candidatus Falkowbacteria bacterium CG10_big_fil_rev_8_21_14_0_10_38_22]|uniref:Uncharacterized protein n=2 Tax=Candidatus Falkowiibacteriota TaxID=1752728 RepID=A0A2M6WRP2_9BACT|nr:MAG: hypothetical protein COT96_01120 [Candidatus Falkowbacteria bacterium CG10_big_fil_rev_8_21_14_0_10_38_22]